jgi:hypothetical protein
MATTDADPQETATARDRERPGATNDVEPRRRGTAKDERWDDSKAGPKRPAGNAGPRRLWSTCDRPVRLGRTGR